MDFRNQKDASMLVGMLTAARKLARIPIVVSCCSIAVLGSLASGGIAPSIVVAVLVIVLLLVHGNAINDLADYSIDKINLKNASDRPLLSQDITRRQLWILQAVCGLAAVGLSFLLGPIAGAATIIVATYSYAYSLSPLRITDKTILSPLTLPATYTFQPFIVGYFSANRPSYYTWLLAIGIYFGFIARILLKDFRDVKGDKKFGKQTFLIRFGSKATCIVSGICAFASLVFIAVAINFSPGALVSLALGNIIVLWLLSKLAATKKMSDQLRLIKVTAQIGNCSILTLLVYFASKNYLPHQTTEHVLLPLVPGLALFLLTKRMPGP